MRRELRVQSWIYHYYDWRDSSEDVLEVEVMLEALCSMCQWFVLLLVRIYIYEIKTHYLHFSIDRFKDHQTKPLIRKNENASFSLPAPHLKE